MLQEFNFLPKDSFYIWFDRKYKKEYYITQLAMCKIKFIKEIDNKFNSIKLIKNYSKRFNGEEKIYFSKSDILNPFEENYGMFLINFINADFSSFESAYLTYFCFYGIGLLEEFCNNIPTIRAFNSEQEFKDTYKDIFDQSKIKLKKLQNNIRLCVNHTYNLKRQDKYKNSSYITKFIAYSINKNLFKYATNINVYYNINYAYKVNDIKATNITPLAVKEKIDDRIINPTESNIYNSEYISNLVYLSLNEIVTNSNVSIGICQNCGKYFISYKKAPEKYCRITYSENEEICKDIGIQVTYKKKQKQNPCLSLYRKTYQKKLMYAKRSENENIKHKFDNWKKLAKEKVKEFNNGVISENELIDWLKNS